MSRILTAILLLASFTNTFAQLEQTARFEIEKKFTDENFIVLSAGENGIMLFRESNEKVKNLKGNIWQIMMVNNELDLVWDIKLAVDYKHTILGYEYFDNNLYLLFEEELSGRNKDFLILKIDQKDGSNNKYEISTELDLSTTNLLINDVKMVLVGEIN